MNDEQRIPQPQGDPQIGEDALNEEDRLRNDARRTEQRRDALNEGYLLVARSVPWIILGVVLIMLWHYFGYEPWTWISPGRIEKIETIANGGLVAAILFFLRRYVPPH